MIHVELVEGISKKTKQPYTAVLVRIGDWSRLVFPRGPIELNYIKNILEQYEKGAK